MKPTKVNEDIKLKRNSKSKPRFNINIKKLTVQLVTLFFMIGLPIITLIVSEMIVREALTMPFSDWIVDFTKRFAVNILLLIAIFNVLYILPRKWFMFTSLLLSGLLVGFAFANKLKIELRNSPITIGDFALFSELNGLDNPVDLNMPLIIGVLIAFIAVVVMIFLLIPKFKENWIIKTGAFLISATFLVVLWTDYPVSPMEKVQFQNTWWQQEVGTMRNGLYGNFTMLAKETKIDPPAGYSENKIQSIGEQYMPAEGTSGEKPNVIFLMSEAFTDPYHFGEQHFTQDPIPNFHKLYNESMHGTMYSPEFGGGTANVEFEALTGLSRQFIADNNVAYQLYVKKPLPSVAYAFRDAGYSTTAIHSYFGWYYQRQSVYRLLGFDRFISGEFIDLDHEIGSGWGFPKDKHMTDSTIDALDKTKERDFIHAVSAEGHQPYKPLADSVFLKTGTLPDITRQYLNKYSEKMNNIDKELGRLVEKLKDRDEPTILVFFGDHYPTFGNNNQVFGSQGTKIANNMLGDYEDFINVHDVPYFIWSSEGNEPKQLDLSPNQFGAISLEMAGVKGNTVTALLDSMRAKGDSVIPYNQWQKQMGSQTKEMKDLQVIQHDLLHGSRFTEDSIPNLIQKPNKEYHQGLYSSMTIQKITNVSNQYEIFVKGAPRYSNLVNKDGKEINTEWKHIKNGVASFTVNKKDIDPKESYRLVVNDSLDNILMSTKFHKLSESE